ncbi:MAG TPA: hypothetical protein ENJ28_04315 [Gammaproteobacteria bacterium]|nr:hypothetical protein [Gammaproteobacteria bacterium]
MKDSEIALIGPLVIMGAVFFAFSVFYVAMGGRHNSLSYKTTSYNPAYYKVRKRVSYESDSPKQVVTKAVTKLDVKNQKLTIASILDEGDRVLEQIGEE